MDSSCLRESPRNVVFQDRDKPREVRNSNITAAKAVCDFLRTSLGPNGMDKMIQSGNGDVTITNDGATILKQMKVLHPAAKILVDLAKAQDAEAGDGTTTVVVIAGRLLDNAERLIGKGIHPSIVSKGYYEAANKALEILDSVALPVNINDRGRILQFAKTALSSKVVRSYSDVLAPIAVDAVMQIVHTSNGNNVDLKDVKIIKQTGRTVEDTTLIHGLLLKNECEGFVSRVENAKIAVVQFCVSPPKPNMEHQVVLSEYSQMDRYLREERQYILNVAKHIRSTGCTVILFQKSLLREAVSDLALHYFSKMKIMIVKNIDKEDVEFLCRSLSCKPIASLDHFVPEALVHADLVKVTQEGGEKFIEISGIGSRVKTATVFLRGSNNLILDEVERSLRDALCVVRCLVKKPEVVFGAGAAESEISMRLLGHAAYCSGYEGYCCRAFAEAVETIPHILAQNAGLDPSSTVSKLYNLHAAGQVFAGIHDNEDDSNFTPASRQNVEHPLQVLHSAITLATEAVASILKIDDIVETVGK